MPLRDLLLAGIIGATLPLVFRYAFVGVLLWTWVGIMNPHKLGWGFMFDAPVANVIGIVTLIALFTTKDRVQLPLMTPLVFMMLLVVWCCITTGFAIFPTESLDQLEKVLKIQLMILVAAAVLYKWEHFRLFIWVNVLSLAFYGVKGGIYTILTAGGGRVWGPPGGFIAGNNELALALIMAIPLMHYLRMTTPYVWVKRLLLLMMVLSAVSAVGTQSRGAFIAIAAMGAFLWWRAPNKLTNLILLSALAASIWVFMPQSWHDRMATIKNYEQDGSAMGRIFAWQTAVNIANDRITGGGFEIYNRTVRYVYAPGPGGTPFDPMIPRAAHSIYFQMLGEHGYIGLILFMMIWITAWRLASSIRRRARGDPNRRSLFLFAGMVQVSIVAWLAGGAFLSLSYWDFPYHLVIALIVVERWRQEVSQLPEVAAPVLPDGLRQLRLRERMLWFVRTV